MTVTNSRSKVTPSQARGGALKSFVIVLIAVGIFFRFFNLGEKVYWNDEVVSSLRANGYTETELFGQLYQGQVVSQEELAKFLAPSPQKEPIDVLESLAIEEPQSPPLYYLLLHFWMKGLGDSVASVRAFSAVISLLVFPCLYLVCQELFQSPQVGWIAMAIIALSPFQFLYAQEARLYSLWTVTILLMCQTFLRALRLNTRSAWGLHIAAFTLGCYTFPFSLFVALGNFLYVTALAGFRPQKRLVAPLLASTIGFVVYSPWIVFIILNSHKMSSFREAEIPLIDLVMNWNGNLRYAFIDFNTSIGDAISTLSSNPAPNILYLLAALLTLPLLAYAIYYLVKSTPKRIWLYLLFLMGTTTVILGLPDLILGGQRSVYPRYFMPTYLALQITIAYSLSGQISHLEHWRRLFGKIILVGLMVAGIASGVASAQANTWWTKGMVNQAIEVAEILNNAPQPALLVSNGATRAEGTQITLSTLLRPSVKYLLTTEAALPELSIPSSSFPSIFVYSSSEPLTQQLQAEYPQMKFLKNFEVSGGYGLWQIQ